MKHKKEVLIVLLGLTAAFSAYALSQVSNPASTDYVDAKIAILQAEINQIIDRFSIQQ